jgi:hypothetical protein
MPSKSDEGEAAFSIFHLPFPSGVAIPRSAAKNQTQSSPLKLTNQTH